MTSLRANHSLRPDPATADVADASWANAMRQLENTRREIALENRLAAGSNELHPKSPHLEFAGRIARAMQGAVLGPEAREELVRQARGLGLRPFDAHLVIAVVQDRRRRGESLEDITGPLAVLGRRKANRGPSNARVVLAGTALGLAASLAIVFVRWLTSI